MPHSKIQVDLDLQGGGRHNLFELRVYGLMVKLGGTPHMKMQSIVHSGVGTPHMKMYSNVLTGVGTLHNFKS